MPCLLLRNAGLVKTVKFADPTYLGDPINAVRIFNEREVDELVVLDIEASAKHREPPFALIEELAGECFMPLTYGGGVQTVEQMERIFRLGVEKICINTAAIENPQLVAEASSVFGSQSIVVSIDVKRNFWGAYQVLTNARSSATRENPIEMAIRMADLGAGEIFLNSVDRDGTMKGYDIDLIASVTSSVSVPVIACGGAGSLLDVAAAVRQGGASAAAAGSMFVFHGKHRAVLISFPEPSELAATLPDDPDDFAAERAA
jgi:cyclase